MKKSIPLIIGTLLLSSSTLAAEVVQCDARPRGINENTDWFFEVYVSSIQECMRRVCAAAARENRNDVNYVASASIRTSRFRTVNESFYFDANCG